MKVLGGHKERKLSLCNYYPLCVILLADYNASSSLNFPTKATESHLV